MENTLLKDTSLVTLEKDNYDYVYVDKDNIVHLLCPIASGDTIGLEATREVKQFFGFGNESKGKSAHDVLTRYCSDLKSDIDSLDVFSPNGERKKKAERLEQIKGYLKWLAIVSNKIALEPGPHGFYPEIIKELLQKKTNCLSMLLAPSNPDSYLNGDSHVFSLKRFPPNFPHQEAILRDTLKKHFKEIQNKMGKKEREVNDLTTSHFKEAIALGDDNQRTEKLSILTQFFLGEVNVFCHIKNKSKENFGKILEQEGSEFLKERFVKTILDALANNKNVEECLIKFINNNYSRFGLSGIISDNESKQIIGRFNVDYRTVKDAKEMDEFTLFFPDIKGDFVNHKNRISFDFASFGEKFLDQLLNTEDDKKFFKTHIEAFTKRTENILPAKNNIEQKNIIINNEQLIKSIKSDPSKVAEVLLGQRGTQLLQKVTEAIIFFPEWEILRQAVSVLNLKSGGHYNEFYSEFISSPITINNEQLIKLIKADPSKVAKILLGQKDTKLLQRVIEAIMFSSEWENEWKKLKEAVSNLQQSDSKLDRSYGELHGEFYKKLNFEFISTSIRKFQETKCWPISFDVDMKYENGNTILMLAIENKDINLAKVLLEKGADPNTENNSGSTPLLRAIQSDHIEIVKMLLEKGADPIKVGYKKEGYEGVTPLREAINKRNPEIINLLRRQRDSILKLLPYKLDDLRDAFKAGAFFDDFENSPHIVKLFISEDAKKAYAKKVKFRELKNTTLAISDTLFRNLFGEGYTRDKEKTKIQEDLLAMVANANEDISSLLLNVLDNNHKPKPQYEPLFKALSAQYLSCCDFTRASYFFRTSGIKFTKNIPKEELLSKLTTVINNYENLNKDEITAINNIAIEIGEKIESKWLKPYIPNSIVSHLFKLVSSQKSKNSNADFSDQLKILSSEEIGSLVKRYNDALHDAKKPYEIADKLNTINWDDILPKKTQVMRMGSGLES